VAEGPAELIAALRRIVGENRVTTGNEIAPRHLADARLGMASGERPLAVVRPGNAEEIAGIVKLCRARKLPVVPQGGLTGLSGGAVPLPGSVVVSLDRLNTIEEIDTAAATITVGAGVPLEAVQRAADDAGFLFTLDLGARGSAQIGGNVATNAGGNRVVRYGMTRAAVLGMEVVLADGTVITSLNKMMKDNAGYDLKQLFIGSEGTLGIITRLVLRLVPKPRTVATAFCGLAGFDRVLAFLARARSELGDTLAAFEGMWPEFYRIAIDEGGKQPPLPQAHAIYVLIEAMGSDPARDPERFGEFMEGALADDLIADAVIAQSEAERRGIWSIRDSSAEFLRTLGTHFGFDVSVPIGSLGDFVDDLGRRLAAAFPKEKPARPRRRQPACRGSDRRRESDAGRGRKDRL
jgi:FAD/FMN-containing dehydrogenase